jgi:voltage-gated potassium channel
LSIYDSFATLTTLGFGDVLPVSPVARGLTIWGVILGQFYLAVLVAGLVNLRAARDFSTAES